MKDFLRRQSKQSQKAYTKCLKNTKKEFKKLMKLLNKQYAGVKYLFPEIKQRKPQSKRFLTLFSLSKQLDIFSQDMECPDIIVSGKKRPAVSKTQKNKTKRLILQDALDKKFLSAGFSKEYDHSGAFSQYSKPFPLSTFKNVFKSIFSTGKHYDGTQKEDREQYADKFFYEDSIFENLQMRKLRKIFQDFTQKLEEFSNVSFGFVFEIQHEQGFTRVQGKNIEEFIINLVKHFLRYTNRGDIIQEKLQNFDVKFNIVATKNNIQTITKGRILEQMLKHSWYIINPATKQHCVSDCFVILKMYRSEKTYHNMWQYVKKRGDEFAKANNIQKGCHAEKLKELAQKFQVDVFYDVYDEKELSERDAFFIVCDGHCMIALNPENPRSQILYDLSERFNKQQQKLMEKWEPKQKQVCIVTYDFEWFVEQEKQIPYAFGIFSKYGYQDHLTTENIYQKFVDYLLATCQQIFDIEYLPNLQENEKAETLYIHFVAHNSHKADYPLIEKYLLSRPELQRISELASGQQKISYDYKIITGNLQEYNVIVVFQDSINLFAGSLDDFGKSMGLEIKKGECNHKIICRENYIQQINDQKIADYLRLDCEVLYRAFLQYDKNVKRDLGFSFIENRCFTSPSISEKYYFGQFYKDNIYQQTDVQQEFCKNAYKGGMTDNFRRGVFENVISVDVNSSYPYQMCIPLPCGKTYRRVFNKNYSGEPLSHGIYQIIVISSPETLYPILCDVIDGKLQFMKFRNHMLYATQEEVVMAYSRGYKIHLLEAEVTDVVQDLFSEYINKAYSIRNEKKRLMKQAKQDGDIEKVIQYDAQQNLQKLMMNSLYGKFGQCGEQEISNFVTSDTNFLLQQFALGNISEIQKINDRYTAYSGVQKRSTPRSNFIIASYITARARMHLIKALEQFSLANFLPIYSDTDSIYLQETQNSDYSKIQHLLDSSKLGGFKMEMCDNVAEDRAIGCFIAPKLYALKGPNTLKEKIVARGVMRWMFGEKEKDYQRREDEGQKQVVFDDIYKMLSGTSLQITRQQQYIRKSLLSDLECDNIKIQKGCTTSVCGQITKKIVSPNTGICRPIVHQGEFQVPQQTKIEDDILEFPTIVNIENHFNDNFDDIASNYCVFRNEQTNKFFVMINPSVIPQFLATNNQNAIFHQVFGKWIIPTIDIDLKIDSEEEKQIIGYDEVNPEITQHILSCIAKRLDIEPNELLVTDRSRPQKISYHIRAPDYVIDRDAMNSVAFALINKDSLNEDDQQNILSKIDLQIYKTCGQLRLSDNSAYYRQGLKQIQIVADKLLLKRKEAKQKTSKTPSTNTESSIKNSVQQFLQNSGLCKGWKYRDSKICKSITYVNLTRLPAADSFCEICKCNHHKDNYKILKMTATKISVSCRKAQ